MTVNLMYNIPVNFIRGQFVHHPWKRMSGAEERILHQDYRVIETYAWTPITKNLMVTIR